jgi:hypothetical protein
MKTNIRAVRVVSDKIPTYVSLYIPDFKAVALTCPIRVPLYEGAQGDAH